jgi:hypothetical protein
MMGWRDAAAGPHDATGGIASRLAVNDAPPVLPAKNQIMSDADNAIVRFILSLP